MSLLWAQSAAAEYKLGSGDVLELALTGSPDIRVRATVNLDGEVALPLFGQLKVAGLSLSEIRTNLETSLRTKMLTRRGMDGRESVSAISPDELTLNIVEYRPIYVDGDVSKPGDQTFRPSMTVRQAVAVAGGYDIVRFRVNNPVLELADLKSEAVILKTEHEQAEANISRLKAELSGKPDLDSTLTTDNRAPLRSIPQVVAIQSDLLKTRNADFGKEKNYLSSAIGTAQLRRTFLSEQQQKEAEGVQLDTDDLNRIKTLYEKGQGTIMRVTDARRALLLSSTRNLQTVAQITQVELQRDELDRKLQKIDDARRIEVLRELDAATLKLATIQSKIRAVGEKMFYVGALRSALLSGTQSDPEVTVFRRGNGGQEETIVAREDTELMPGDVVRVVLNPKRLTGALP